MYKSPVKIWPIFIPWLCDLHVIPNMLSLLVKVQRTTSAEFVLWGAPVTHHQAPESPHPKSCLLWGLLDLPVGRKRTRPWLRSDNQSKHFFSIEPGYSLKTPCQHCVLNKDLNSNDRREKTHFPLGHCESSGNLPDSSSPRFHHLERNLIRIYHRYRYIDHPYLLECVHRDNNNKLLSKNAMHLSYYSLLLL